MWCMASGGLVQPYTEKHTTVSRPPPPLRVLLRVHRQSEVLATLAPTEHVVQIWNGLESGAGSESCRVSGGLSLYCKSSSPSIHLFICA